MVLAMQPPNRVLGASKKKPVFTKRWRLEEKAVEMSKFL